jgi:ribosomal-protein-alanine N-acetyltransferase
MDYADISQVVAIDKQVFSMPWTANSYAYEIGESPYSYMVVLENRPQDLPHHPTAGMGWRGLVRKLIGNGDLHANPGQVVSYGGMWSILEEAHISTVATDPNLRGKGYGELILAAMIRRAITLKAGHVVLEVRVGNVVAQNLYHKYDFKIIYTKKAYYHNNHEDAYDMRLDLNDETIARFQQRYEKLMARHQFVDRYTDTTRPRHKQKHR